MARSGEGDAGSAVSSSGWATATVRRLSCAERGRRHGGGPAAAIMAHSPAFQRVWATRGWVGQR
uniref:Uncharacterized protein n=1 Tax=Oryza sativa subsp. japonica TaxID=39947 RepID=Q5Z4L7_ORYSJ|nr:hypothetical protein [Oryza sativa Japonica Group]BAD62315.1 hypothetical protein [Oryza sativa Japonica Group]